MEHEAPFIDVRQLIARYSIEELNQAAEEYFAAMPEPDRVLAKPFSSSNDATHLLIQVSYLLQGLEVYPGMRVVDFGCGPGWASRMLNQMGFEVLSVDVSPTALDMARRLAAHHPVFGSQPPHSFHRFDGHRLPIDNASVDRIFCLDAFHHVSDQRHVLAEMARILREGGIAGFAEPGPRHSHDPSSQLEMRNYKVIENDIVLQDIERMAHDVGFTQMKVSLGSVYPVRLHREQLERLDANSAAARSFLGATLDRCRNYPIFFLHKGCAAVDDSREMQGLVAEIEAPEALSATAHEPFTLEVRVRNMSNKRWLPSGSSPGSVNIGYFVHRLDGPPGEAMATPQYRAHLSDAEMLPGAKVERAIPIAGLARGRYRIDVDLVSEYVRWFQANGSVIASVMVTVTG